MPISKQQVANNFNVQLKDIEQINHRQLFILKMPGVSYLISYLTIVGKFCWQAEFNNACWTFTRHKYSRTTSKQLTQFSHTHKNVIWQDEPFEQLH